jgi:ribosomal-protein-alanine N-acetyltransferase
MTALLNKNISVYFIFDYMYVIAQTPRFFIRQFIPTDEEAYLALFDDKEVTLHIPKRSRHENQQMFRDSLNDYESGKILGRWGLFNNGSDEFIGICLLRMFRDDERQVELGYVLKQRFWGKGIAGEMAQIMVAYAFTHADAAEVVAVTTTGNIGSQRVLLKAGLERGENFVRDGHEVAFFSLKRS